MHAVVRYIGRRLIAYLLTIFIAISANFFIPRLIPGDPISALIDQMAQHGEVVSGGAEIVAAYKEQFGLNGTWFEQYTRYLLSLARGDLGPSIMAFPTTVQELVVTALPWTMGLLLVATVISWVLGNLPRRDSRLAPGVEGKLGDCRVESRAQSDPVLLRRHAPGVLFLVQLCRFSHPPAGSP